VSNWNWSNDPAQLGDLLETNVCVHCVWDLELLAGVGWLHREDPRGLEITCRRPEPAKSICLTCGNYCYAYPNGELYRHSGPFLGSLCRGSGKTGTPPTPEEKAFAPYG
jgi:hypothetical protein